jgi:lipopolysaccharide/colanic/teichoic acid biosynthesis glycosyltransferase
MIEADAIEPQDAGMVSGTAFGSAVIRRGRVDWAGDVKRVLDIVGGLILLVFGLPILLVAALAILTDDGWPVFFWSSRVGRDGRHFRALKLRTMHVNADDLLRTNADLQETFDLFAKLPNDPRITRIGSLLRLLSIDELPQALNVIAGQMSLVGPRPGLLSELDKWGAFAVERVSVRPGLTGLWQVSGRSLLSYDERLRLDAQYIADWSLMLDIKILLRTLPAVVSGKGAS